MVEEEEKTGTQASAEDAGVLEESAAPLEEQAPLPKTPAPEEPTAPEAPPEEPAPQPAKEHVEPGLGSRIKNWILIILLLLIVIGAGLFYFWRTGVSDLKNDNTFLIVVQEKGVAKAASVYVLSDDKAHIINVEELPAASNIGIFYEEAECKWQRERRPDLIRTLQEMHSVEEPSCNQILDYRRVIDRVIVVRVNTIQELSTEPFLGYRGHQIPSRDLGGYLTGSYWDVTLAGDDPPWMFRANLLSQWVELYDQKILEANYGSQVYKKIFTDYRAGNIRIHPWNPALFILKYIPVEQIFL